MHLFSTSWNEDILKFNKHRFLKYLKSAEVHHIIQEQVSEVALDSVLITSLFVFLLYSGLLP